MERARQEATVCEGGEREIDRKIKTESNSVRGRRGGDR
jgi:hypothetical protein